MIAYGWRIPEKDKKTAVTGCPITLPLWLVSIYQKAQGAEGRVGAGNLDGGLL